MTDSIDVTVIFWRDIPTQIAIGAGRRAKKHQLADRFMVAVDKAAMNAGASSTDDYLEDWVRKTVSFKVEADADQLNAVAEQLEQTYPTTRLAELARNGGNEENGILQ